MPNYIYNDEDNYPMDDPDKFYRATGYNSMKELEYYESGQADADRLEAEIEKERQAVAGIADILGLTGACRTCPEFTELAEGFLDKEHQISAEQLRFLEMQCSLCGGKGTGKPLDEKHAKRVEHHWQDVMEWVKVNDMKFHCLWCPNTYRVYGQYKDPDDEWKAIEDLCCNCKHFGED